MTDTPVLLQELKRGIYLKAKEEVRGLVGNGGVGTGCVTTSSSLLTESYSQLACCRPYSGGY